MKEMFKRVFHGLNECSPKRLILIALMSMYIAYGIVLTISWRTGLDQHPLANGIFFFVFGVSFQFVITDKLLEAFGVYDKLKKKGLIS